MGTLKFDLIAQELMRLVKDEFVTSFTPGAGLMPAGSILRSREIISEYVNRALLKVFNDIWASAGGDVAVFARLVPELVVTREVSITQVGDNGTYTIASPNFDIYELAEISTSSGLGVVGKKELIQSIEKGSVLQYTGTTAKPIGVFMGDTIYLYPYASLAKITAVKQPINPTSGVLLVQNGIYDSPYAMHWNSRIASVAYGLYLADSQTQS